MPTYFYASFMLAWMLSNTTTGRPRSESDWCCTDLHAIQLTFNSCNNHLQDVM